MLSFDLKWGYHHVDIFPDQSKYLSFSWTFLCGRTRFFEFTVLAFGLSSAPYLFTKLLKPLVRKWRSGAKGIVVYLDDGLGSAVDYNNAKTASLPAHADLCHPGFLANESKCVWEPTQVISWLGSVISTTTSRCRHRQTDCEFAGCLKFYTTLTAYIISASRNLSYILRIPPCSASSGQV